MKLRKHWKLLLNLSIILALGGSGAYFYQSGKLQNWMAKQTIPFQYFGSPAIAEQATKETAIDPSVSFNNKDQTTIKNLATILNGKSIYINQYAALFSDSSYNVLTKVFKNIEHTPHSFPQSSGVAYVGWYGSRKQAYIVIPWFTDEDIIKNIVISAYFDKNGKLTDAKKEYTDQLSYNLPVVSSISTVNPEYQVSLAKSLINEKLGYIKSGGNWNKIVNQVPSQLQNLPKSSISAFNIIGASFSTVDTGLVTIAFPNKAGTSIEKYIFQVNLNNETVTEIRYIK